MFVMYTSEFIVIAEDEVSMDPVQRRVALVLIQFGSSVAVEELSFAILVVVWVPVFRSATRESEEEHSDSYQQALGRKEEPYVYGMVAKWCLKRNLGHPPPIKLRGYNH